jgi:hypothetical protein
LHAGPVLKNYLGRAGHKDTKACMRAGGAVSCRPARIIPVKIARKAASQITSVFARWPNACVMSATAIGERPSPQAAARASSSANASSDSRIEMARPLRRGVVPIRRLVVFLFAIGLEHPSLAAVTSRCERFRTSCLASPATRR